ncbi:MAG: universal stress protein [Chloroflexota bacterium]|nr:universal stress protein [Chloroflexota bacterium]
MFDHIVVPLDGSKLSEATLAYVAPLARSLGSKVVLLHAYDNPYVDLLSAHPGAREIAPDQNAVAAASDYLNGTRERLQSDGVQCDIRIMRGAPAAVILKYIEERQPDLIAMSTHGRSGLRRMLVGSVTTTILPRAETPVLIVHPDEGEEQPETSFESLVVPLDMSYRSEHILPVATELADALNLDTTLVTCVPSQSQLYIGSGHEVYPYPDDLMEQAQESAEEYLQSSTDAAARGRQRNVRWECLDGGPAGAIVEYAESQPNSLIAMCTQGRTGLGRWVLGSVTDAVIRSGNTPVLVVPQPPDAPSGEPALAV